MHTTHRQGGHIDEAFTYGTTFFDGIKEHFNQSEVEYLPGVTVDGQWLPGRQEALKKAKAADVIIACVGEKTYAEKPGYVRSC